MSNVTLSQSITAGVRTGHCLLRSAFKNNESFLHKCKDNRKLELHFNHRITSCPQRLLLRPGAPPVRARVFAIFEISLVLVARVVTRAALYTELVRSLASQHGQNRYAYISE